MRRVAWILTLSLTLALAGDAPAAEAVQRITITMRDFSYSPSKITVQAGTPVEITLVNKGKVAHEFMMYDLPRAMGSMGPMGGTSGSRRPTTSAATT
ncbi:MAG: cupredoxin domain-containing protein [Armatimonadota bacterium]|nr:cupredoxin domain-containing protein [Armatimonadota bacterium]